MDRIAGSHRAIFFFARTWVRGNFANRLPTGSPLLARQPPLGMSFKECVMLCPHRGRSDQAKPTVCANHGIHVTGNSGPKANSIPHPLVPHPGNPVRMASAPSVPHPVGARNSPPLVSPLPCPNGPFAISGKGTARQDGAAETKGLDVAGDANSTLRQGFYC